MTKFDLPSKRTTWLETWFPSVATEQDAVKVLKSTRLGLFIVAALQLGALLILAGLNYSTGKGLFLLTNVSDIVLLVACAHYLPLRQSRFLAIVLLLYSLWILLITVMARLGMPISGGTGGRNILLALYLVYASVYAFRASASIHAVRRTRILKSNIVKNFVVAFCYLAFGMSVVVLAKGLWFDDWLALHGLNEEQLDTVGGGGMLLFGMMVVWLCAIQVLPLTKRPNIRTERPDVL